MKLLSFRVNGNSTFGVLRDDRVVDTGAILAGRYGSLKDALTNQLDGVAAAAGRTDASTYSLNEIDFLPPLYDADKTICIGRNYRAHIEERNFEVPAFPRMFVKYRSSLVGHNQSMVRPAVSDQYDFEGEFCLVIGKTGRHIAEADAMSYVAGYSIMCDGSIRDYQQHSLLAGKNFQQASSMGPWIVTADEITNPETPILETRLNGETMQRSAVGDLVFGYRYLISYASRAFELMPGDVIAVGTPSGVGSARIPPVWMTPGDVLEIEVEGIGTLRNPIIGE